MKNKIWILVLGILLVGIVVAGILDRNIIISKEQKTALERINLTDYGVIDYEIGTEEVERCLFKEICHNETQEIFNDIEWINQSYEVCKGRINTCKRFDTWWMKCLTFNNVTMQCELEEKIYYGPEEMTAIKDIWEQKRIEQIADATIKRQAEPDKTKVSEGETIITSEAKS